MTSFALACSNNILDIVNLLLNTPCFNSLNTKDSDGNTPFFIACKNNYYSIVDLIMNADGFHSLNEKNNCGESPISIACSKNNYNIVKLLLAQKNIIISEYDKYVYVCKNKHKNVIKYLLHEHKQNDKYDVSPPPYTLYDIDH